MSFQSTGIRDCAMFCYEQQGGMQVFSEGSTGCGCVSENIAPPVQDVVARQS